LAARRFPSPWSVEEDEDYFVVRDHDGQQLAYVTSITRAQRPSRSPATRRGGSRRISPSCRELLSRHQNIFSYEIMQMSHVGATFSLNAAVKTPRTDSTLCVSRR